MNKFKAAFLAFFAVAIVVAAGIVMTGLVNPRPSVADPKVAELEAKLKVYTDKEESDKRLGQYTVNMMFKSPETVKQLSPAYMLSLAQDIVEVDNNIFDKEIEKRGFIGALQIESRFLKYAQSPTGPKGLAQVARKTFHYSIGLCGIPAANDNDAWDTKLNLYAGACYFKEQLNANNGDVIAAIVAYNQGPNDDDAKRYPKDGVVKGHEPLAYVVKWVFNNDHTTDTKMPGVPAISDLPKPVKPQSKLKSHK